MEIYMKKRKLELEQQEEDEFGDEFGQEYTGKPPETMIISPVKANLLRDTDTFGKMEVYCVFKVGDKSEKSNLAKGTKPEWDE